MLKICKVRPAENEVKYFEFNRPNFLYLKLRVAIAEIDNFIIENDVQSKENIQLNMLVSE